MAAIEIAARNRSRCTSSSDLGAADGRPRCRSSATPSRQTRAAALVDAGLHRIDADGRAADSSPSAMIGGGEAELAAELLAVLDAALDLPGPAQQRARPAADAAGLQVLAHLGRGKDLAAGVACGGIDAVTPKPCTAAEIGASARRCRAAAGRRRNRSRSPHGRRRALRSAPRSTKASALLPASSRIEMQHEQMVDAHAPPAGAP